MMALNGSTEFSDQLMPGGVASIVRANRAQKYLEKI